MRRGGEGPSVAQVGWRTGVAESRKFFGRGGAVGGGNQHRGSADRLVLYCPTFSALLSRPPAAGPLCPLRWAFIRRHPHRWVANPRGPENPIRSHTDIARKGTRTSAAGGRTSVSAPLGIYPETLAPMGRQSAWTGNPNPLTHRHHAERVQNQRRGSADLCVRPLSVHPRILAPMGSQSAWAVRAAGRSSEDRRTSGQRTRVEWKRRS
jgi:hypothetical protein